MRILTGHWFLAQDFLDQMIEQSASFVLDQEAFVAFIEQRSSAREGTDLFIRKENVAHIPIMGVLTEQPDFFFDIFGGGNSVYGDIVAAIAAAEGDSEINRIVLEINSPGGTTAGFLRTARAIASTSKPTEAQVTNMAASAAFGLATQADTLVVEDAMTMVGSVGVATTMFINESRIQIASTEAPNKKPDVSTEEGVAIVRAQLDVIHAEFAQVIAAGRHTTVATVNADFGRGSMVIAAEALQAGMIDGISSGTSGQGSNPSETSAKTESDSMNLSELKAAHPGLYTEIHALGVVDGTKSERERVTALVNAAQELGQPEIAVPFVIGGESITSQLVAGKFLTAGINGREASNRADDTAGGEGGEGGAAPTNANGTRAGDDPKPDADALTHEMFDELESNMDIDTGRTTA